MRAAVFMINDCCTDTSLCFQTRMIAKFARRARQRMGAFAVDESFARLRPGINYQLAYMKVPTLGKVR